MCPPFTDSLAAPPAALTPAAARAEPVFVDSIGGQRRQPSILLVDDDPFMLEMQSALLQSWRLMREIDCDLAQGYFIARPMASNRIEEWLELWQARRARLVAS